MTHNSFPLLKANSVLLQKKKLNCHRAIYFWEKCCEWNVDRETSVIPIPGAITTLSADIQFQPQLYSQCSFPPALLNTFTLPVSWPSVSWLPHRSLWQLAGNGWPQLASDQALWPAGQLSGAAGIQCTVFWGKSVNIYLQARIVYRTLWHPDLVPGWLKRKTSRPRLVLPEANILPQF